MTRRFRLRLLRKLRRDEDGHVTLYFALMLPVLFGFIGLVLDGGALLNLNSDQQDLADAAALAGAAELDGCGGPPDCASDAITRARNRAINLLNNDPRWSNVALSGVQILTTDPPLTFYSSLNPDTPATGPADASYIRVTTLQRDRTPTFLLALGSSTNQSSATAVAGSHYVACNVQPLMLCNPLEATTPDFTATPGQLFEFTPTGSTGGFSPGDFSLLDPAGATNSGGPRIRELLSQQSPKMCYVNKISPRPGQVTNMVNDGIDVRFDMPPGGGPGAVDQTPAPNVIKGWIPSAPQHLCNYGPQYVYEPANANHLTDGKLPGATDMTSYGAVKIGNTMDMTAANIYSNHHHGADWPTMSTSTSTRNFTRYEVYLWENNLGPDLDLGDGVTPTFADYLSDNSLTVASAPVTRWAGVGTERPDKQCAPSAAGNEARRTISVAVVNCIANNVRGNAVNNMQSNKYADFFVTQPARFTDTIMAEFVRWMTPQGAGTKLKHIVQLYR